MCWVWLRDRDRRSAQAVERRVGPLLATSFHLASMVVRADVEHHPQSARARIGQRTWASVAQQVKPARMMPTSPPSCKCTTRRYAFGRLRAVLCSSVWTPRSSVATLCAAIPRHPGLRLAQRGQDLTPSWRARPLQRSRTQLQLHGSVLLQVCGAPDWLRGHGTDHHARARGLPGPAARDP